MYKRCLCLIGLILGMHSLLSAQDTPTSQPSIPEKLAIIKGFRSSVVRVAYTLKYDKGESPNIGGWGGGYNYCCSGNSFGRFHGDDGDVIEQERPYETPGYILSPTKIVAPDMQIHPRFIKKIDVMFDDQTIPADISAYALDQEAVFLTLEKPLQNAKPLEFTPAAKPPYAAIGYSRDNGEWTFSFRCFSPDLSVTQSDRAFSSAPEGCLIANRKGKPVSLVMVDELPANDSWKGSPNDWATLSEEEMKKELDHLKDVFDKSVVRVTLQFRSPKKGSPDADDFRYRYMVCDGDDSGCSSTEKNVPGIVLNDGKILILANIPAKITARLERIQVHPPRGKPIPAEFQATLKDYGAIVATLPSPPPKELQPLTFADQKILTYRNKLLLTVDVKIQGEKMTTYYNHDRILDYHIGWKGMLFPGEGYRDARPLFDRTGKLVALPIHRRTKVAVKEPWGNDDDVHLTPATDLSAVLNAKDFAKQCDPDNIPLSEEEENRLAWFGVELQALNPQLARMKKITHLTQNGSFGAMVSYVYPGSPAEKADIHVGDILIQLHVSDQPKPIEIRMDNDGYMFQDNSFPWDQLDRIPPEYFDEIPSPWPSVENFMNRTLTDLGFNKPFTVEFVRDGKTTRCESKVTQGPKHYGSAKRYKCKPLNMTVQNLTYEVRRYFRRKPDQEGVIVSRIEPGGPAAVSGIRPYEIVTHINDKPVHTIQDFEKYINEPGKLMLSVKRMNKGRVVRIKKRTATSQPTTAPTTAPASGGVISVEAPARVSVERKEP
jgi:serine protease Do